MESRIRGARLAWGTPILKVGDVILEPPQDRYTHLVVDDNEGCDDSFSVGRNEYSLSFEIPINKSELHDVWKQFKYKIPRKKKKAFKKEFCKRFGVKVKKMRFFNACFNKQRRTRHGR